MINNKLVHSMLSGCLLLLMTFAAFTNSAVFAQTGSTAGGRDVLIVLPFENTSNQKEFNWVGESFSDSLSELLSTPGIASVSSDEREMAYQRLRLPLTTIPSLATAIKIAREAKATLVVLGTYEVRPGEGDKSPAEIHGSSRVIRVNEGRLMGEMMPDGRWASHQYDFGGALTTLQKMQGRLAYQILYQRDKALPFSLLQFEEHATKAPPRAFESYMKGVMTDNAEKRSNYLQNAIREYAKANAGAIYPQPAFELGVLYLKKADWKRAADYFSRLQKRDPHYTESAFYAALCYWRMNDLERALGALVPLTSDTPLTAIYNNAGALSTQAARSEKDGKERTRLLAQAVSLLSRAAESAPDDPTVRFNYAYTLFLLGKYPDATDQLRPVITANPRDGEALFIFSKALERSGRVEAASANDNEARRYLQAYARWETEWQRSQTVAEVPLRLRQDFNRADLAGIEAPEVGASDVSTEDLLAKARTLYDAGNDDDALTELRRILTIEPMSAEAYLMIGRIKQRRGEIDDAISALKTAVFWDAKTIDAHILLGRIFLERKDRAMAMTYARNAVQIDPNNQDALALQRQVQTASP